MFILLVLTHALVFVNWAHAGPHDAHSLVDRFDFDPAYFRRTNLPITRVSVRSLYPRLAVCPPTSPVLCGYTEDGGKTPVKS